MATDKIRIAGARQHNLKNITVELPKHSLTVITGVSGSGKSSLAFDTLYAEGQRRYVESLSTHAQQALERLEKPDVDQIDGLSPAIAIGQHTGTANPRSTIATVTEIYDYLRVLYATCGQPHDPQTGEAVHRFTSQEIVQTLQTLPPGTKLMVLAPLPESETQQGVRLWERLARQGFVRVRIGGRVSELEEKPEIGPPGTPVELVVDRLVVRAESQTRLLDSVLIALRWSGPLSRVLVLVEEEAGGWTERRFTTLYANPETGFRMPPLTPRHFSFNSHLGACPACEGLGVQMKGDPELLVPDPDKSITDGALRTWWSKNAKLKAGQDRQIEALAAQFSVEMKAPFRTLPAAFQKALFYGTDRKADDDAEPKAKKKAAAKGAAKPFEGLVPQAQRLLADSESEFVKQNVRRYMNPSTCPVCQGRRLKPEILGVTLTHEDGHELAVDQFTALNIQNVRTALDRLRLTDQQRQICSEILRELRSRTDFLNNVGLSYLTLNREYGSLSGGEAQRIRLATQLGSRLSGVLYVLDEPSIGLHQRDNDRLLDTLKELRDLGNTVVVVEHDEDTIRAADWLIDLGPGAGPRGGELIASGTPAEVMKVEHSVTARYLNGTARIAIPKRRLPATKRPPTAAERNQETGWLTVHGAEENNLQNIDVSFPLGCFVCVTGVSGSGKSTLVDDILRRELFRRLYHSKEPPGKHRDLSGFLQIDKAVVIDQSPIGRSPRSNPATYVGAFTQIRDLFSQLPSAKVRGYTPGTFSFNTAGGRCEMCEGDGLIRIDMHFLSDVYVTCEACEGKRYNREVLEVTFKGRNIAEVLEMTLDESAEFFRTVPGLGDKLRMLGSVGLGYLKLGQASNTLSGGEAQRIKLAAELAKRATGRTVYLLDEPTTGLHFSDIDTLLRVLFGLRDTGNTLIVIEHNLDVIKCADWVIDMGPEGGGAGGKVVAEGPPEVIAACEASLTGRYLKSKLQ